MPSPEPTENSSPDDGSPEAAPADTSLERPGGEEADNGRVRLTELTADADADQDGSDDSDLDADEPYSATDDWDADVAPPRPSAILAASRSPAFRVVLLLLMAGVLTQIAVYTPEKLQTVAASTWALLLSTDISKARTDPGPGPLVGQLEIISAPTAIELFVDGELSGLTPLELVLTAGAHQLTFVSPIGDVRRVVRVRAGGRTLYSEAIFDGSLMIATTEKTEVLIDGTAVGSAGILTALETDGGYRVQLAPGFHRVDLINPSNGASSSHRVEVFPGQVTTFDGDTDD